MAGTHPRTQLRSSAPHHLRTQIWLICARKPFAGLIYAHRRFCGPFKLPEKHTYCLAMAPSYSKFNPRVAHKRDAALQWLLPTLNFTLGWPTKGCYVVMAPSHSKFYFCVATKGERVSEGVSEGVSE